MSTCFSRSVSSTRLPYFLFQWAQSTIFFLDHLPPGLAFSKSSKSSLALAASSQDSSRVLSASGPDSAAPLLRVSCVRLWGWHQRCFPAFFSSQPKTKHFASFGGLRGFPFAFALDFPLNLSSRPSESSTACSGDEAIAPPNPSPQGSSSCIAQKKELKGGRQASTAVAKTSRSPRP